MSMMRLFAAGCTAAFLAACSNVSLQSEYNPSSYDYRNFATYHGDRDTHVDVYGNPFGMDASTFAEAVTDHMQGANFGRPTNFTTAPGPSAERNLRVVMAFNSPMATYNLCEARPTGGGERSDGLVLKAAWCFDDREDSTVEARIAGATGPNDPRFRALVRETVLNLFPPRMDPELIWDNGDDGGNVPN